MDKSAVFCDDIAATEAEHEKHSIVMKCKL
jgi:hypothetical protein